MIKIFFSALAVGFLALTVSGPAAGQTGGSASGINNLRIEQENRLKVPLEKQDDAWDYLKSRFIDDQTYLRTLDPEFSSYWELEEFWDDYFDTPTWQLLETRSGVRRRTRINHTNPDSAKDGRELIQIKINNQSDNPLDRGEIKFDIARPRQIQTPDDQHPMIGLVVPDQREDFKTRLRDLGIDPYGMKKILTVHDMRSRIYILRAGQPFMTISFDRADSRIWWAEINFVEIEIELNEIGYTDASPAERQYMEEIRAGIAGDIQAGLPYITEDLTPKYNTAFQRLDERLPVRTLTRRNLHNDQGLFLAAMLAAMLIVSAGYLGYRGLYRRGRK